MITDATKNTRILFLLMILGSAAWFSGCNQGQRDGNPDMPPDRTNSFSSVASGAETVTDLETAIADIVRAGGSVERDSSAPGKPVIAVSLSGKWNPSNAHMKYLDTMPHLRKLGVFGIDITDEGLGHVQGLLDLEELAVNNTSITNAGLKHLTRLKHLRTLSITVSDDGLVYLEPLSQLRERF